MPIAALDGLYDPDASPPVLWGSRCRACGATAFPALRWGCEVCGAAEEQLEKVGLAAAGRLHSFATVWLHRAHGIEAPFTIAEIVLDDGPLIRGTLTDPTAEGLQVGQRVAAEWVVTGEKDGREVVEPRFGVVD